MHDIFMPTRRDVLAGAAAMAIAASPLRPALAQTDARGTVFDADSNPRKGVPGVMVSNGLDVVKTDADGRWSLPVRDGDSVFVIKPAGWALPVDAATNLPHFAYVHAPDGSPDLGFRFEGVAPTGPVAGQHRFRAAAAGRGNRASMPCCSPIRSRKA